MSENKKDNIKEILKKNLNKEQYKASIYNGNSIILAGAGTGKTWTLSYKVLNLIGKGVDPKKICVVTFTNKASKEISSRIRKIHEQVGLNYEGVQIGTFHGIFFGILKEILKRKEQFGLKTNYTEDLSIECRNHENIGLLCQKLFGNQNNVNKIVSLISTVKNLGLTQKKEIDNYLSKNDISGEFHELYSEYEKFMEDQNLVDFDDILLLLLKFSKNKNVKEYLGKFFDYICVDEAQDTNGLQFKLLSFFESKITYIGDDFQSIYKFRGAKLKTFIKLTENENNKIFMLTENYRSYQNIVDLGNILIKNNAGQYKKDLKAHRKKSEDENNININIYDNQFSEYKNILKNIKEKKEANKELSWSDFSVIYRTNKQSVILEKFSRELELPYYIKTKKEEKIKKHIEIFFTLLRCLGNENDQTGYLQILKYFFPYEDYYELFIDFSGKKIENIIGFYGNKKLKNSDTINNLKILHNKIEKIKRYKNNLTLNKVINICSELEFNEEQIEEISYIYELFIETGKENNISEFYSWYILEQDDFINEKEINSKNAINFMTIHGAKGLEFKHVYIVGLQDGIFPTRSALKSVQGLEEERRLMYVAVTRAKDSLSLSHSTQIIENGKLKKTNRSIFINEIINSGEVKQNDYTMFGENLENDEDDFFIEGSSGSLF